MAGAPASATVVCARSVAAGHVAPPRLWRRLHMGRRHGPKLSFMHTNIEPSAPLQSVCGTPGTGCGASATTCYCPTYCASGTCLVRDWSSVGSMAALATHLAIQGSQRRALMTPAFTLAQARCGMDDAPTQCGTTANSCYCKTCSSSNRGYSCQVVPLAERHARIGSQCCSKTA